MSGFTTGPFAFDPNLSPFNPSLIAAVLAVVARAPTGLTVGTGTGTGTGTSTNVPMPRFGYQDSGFGGGTSPRYDAGRAAINARGSVTTVAWYQDAGGSDFSSGGNIDTYIALIQAINPNTEVFIYNLPRDCAAGSWPNLNTDVNNVSDAYGDGWLYLSDGVTKPTGDDGSYAIPNGAGYEPAYSDGLKFEAHSAKKFYDITIGGTGDDKASKAKGPWHDNVFSQVPCSGDWYRNHVNQDKGSVADAAFEGTATGHGEAGYFQWLRDNHPTIIRTGNIAGWGLTNVQNGGTNLQMLDGLLHGGLLEGWGGISYGQESFNSWAAAKAQLEFDRAHTTDPKYLAPNLCWNSNGLDNSGHDTGTHWQSAQWQWHAAMQSDCCPTIADLTGNYDSRAFNNWLEDINVDPSTGAVVAAGVVPLWMGPRTTPAWNLMSNGITYGARFTTSAGKNYVSFANPRGNGTVNLVIATEFPGFTHFTHINGVQRVNNGSVVTTLTLLDRDGCGGFLT